MFKLILLFKRNFVSTLILQWKSSIRAFAFPLLPSLLHTALWFKFCFFSFRKHLHSHRLAKDCFKKELVRSSAWWGRWSGSREWRQECFHASARAPGPVYSTEGEPHWQSGAADLEIPFPFQLYWWIRALLSLSSSSSILPVYFLLLSVLTATLLLSNSKS